MQCSVLSIAALDQVDTLQENINDDDQKMTEAEENAFTETLAEFLAAPVSVETAKTTELTQNSVGVGTDDKLQDQTEKVDKKVL